jgi:hypothetical protein
MTEQERKAEHEAFEQASRGMTLGKLRALSEDALISLYDALVNARQNAFLSGPNDYLNELRRREADRQGKRLEWLTWAIVGLTIVLVVIELGRLIASTVH